MDPQVLLTTIHAAGRLLDAARLIAAPNCGTTLTAEERHALDALAFSAIELLEKGRESKPSAEAPKQRRA